MRAFAAALLGGPAYRGSAIWGLGRWLAVLPLLGLAVIMAAACVAGLLATPAVSLEWGVSRLPLAALASLGCLLLALPVGSTRLGPAWLLPIWLGLGPGLAGWSLLAAGQGELARAAEVAALLLPVAVFCLADDGRQLTTLLRRAAAASGAGWSAWLLHAAVRPAASRILRTALILLVLADGLLAMSNA